MCRLCGSAQATKDLTQDPLLWVTSCLADFDNQKLRKSPALASCATCLPVLPAKSDATLEMR